MNGIPIRTKFKLVDLCAGRAGVASPMVCDYFATFPHNVSLGPVVVLFFAQWQRCTYRGPASRTSRVLLRTEEPLFLSLFFVSFRLVFLVIVVLFCFVSLDSDSFFSI